MKPLFILVVASLALVGCMPLAPSPAFAMHLQPDQEQTSTPPSITIDSPTLSRASASDYLPATLTPAEAQKLSAFSTDPYTGPAPELPGDANPLTGLLTADLGLLERRPMAIKVTNFPRSVRPQWGLSQADHVYEYYLENLITRFIGVFYGTDAGRVGPVRSGRFFDEHIVRMYKAIFTFASADYRVLDPWLESDLRNYLVIEREGNCPPLCRIGPSYNYNTLFANTAQLSQYITDLGPENDRPDLSGLHFSANLPEYTQAGSRFKIKYSNVSYNQWEYDPFSEKYLRFQETQDAIQGEEHYAPLVDSLTGSQIAADNVIILLIPHEYFIHTKTTEMVKMDFLGQGGGFAFRDGKMVPILWQRAAEESLLSLRLTDGMPYPLKPGNTWFQVLGRSSVIEHLPDDSYRFEFRIP